MVEKFSYVVIKKLQLQPLKVFTLKNEASCSCSSSSVFLIKNPLLTPFNIIVQDRDHYCTVQHKNTKILGLKGKRQISSVKSTERGYIVTVVKFMSPT